MRPLYYHCILSIDFTSHDVAFRSKYLYLPCGRHLYFTTVMATFCCLEFIASMMFCKDIVEKLNVIGLCSGEAMGELFGLGFFSSTLLLCCALCRDVYHQTSKYQRNEA